jgi:GntP family gluconate:H+ symporter
VVLISAAAVMASYPQVGFPGWLRAVVAGLGDKNLALTVSAGLAMGLLAVRAGGDGGRVRGVIRTAVVEAGEIILVIAAGGALGQALRQAGMAELAGAAMPGRTLALLPLAWGITCLIRVAQGSATVAMITAVGILAPMVGAVDLGYHPVYVALAIGCGSKPGMWMNDSGFWVISKMSALTEGETLRTASVMVCVEGCVGLVVTVLLAWWVPWV